MRTSLVLLCWKSVSIFCKKRLHVFHRNEIIVFNRRIGIFIHYENYTDPGMNPGHISYPNSEM